ncbi:MAG TPA: isochorismatase family protein [Spirochaetota bacterium]|nr:isochorismatase family protein [Spirochaetota bacterium]HPV42331.1 isochorismatase family protein [Spirochaetota bacterium]
MLVIFGGLLMDANAFMLKREDTALIVIDIQERLAAAMKEKIMEQVVKNTAILIETAKTFGMPMVVSEQYRKGLGQTLPALQEKIAGCDVLEKLHFDCTRDDALGRNIASVGRKTFVITGIETHVCVFQTALSLLRGGYRVVVASDAVASRRKHDWEYSLRALAQAGAVIYPTETISFMLLEKAGTAEFKKLAPLFK